MKIYNKKWAYIDCGSGTRKLSDEECKKYIEKLDINSLKYILNGKYLIPFPIVKDYDKDLYNLIESKKQEYIKSCQTI
jgi:hypothetical protein